MRVLACLSLKHARHAENNHASIHVTYAAVAPSASLSFGFRP